MPTSGPSEYLDAYDEGDVLVLVANGPEIRQPEPAQQLGRDALATVDDAKSQRVVLDLHRVKYMSSTGFAVLMNVSRKLQEKGVAIRLCALDPEVQLGANILGLARVVPIDDTRHAALHAIRA